MNTEKKRHTVWLTDEAWNEVKRHYREDNCSVQNEYIEKAIRFYSGYLDTQNAGAYLPRILSDVESMACSATGLYRWMPPSKKLRCTQEMCGRSSGHCAVRMPPGWDMTTLRIGRS